MSTADLFPDHRPADALPEPSREAALERVKAFAGSMGRHYASQRNFDYGPGNRSNVSGLSPHVRHRLITEQELAVAALQRHGLQGAEKFIQEVCWRTYWKGWLDHRPSVWADYRSDLKRALGSLDKDGDLRIRYEAAVAGQTGLECFDVWARELIQTGYLHNHARMWFASIWIYTLNLPWVLGADLFLRHLMDGDPASNTLGWRWVCGLQTVGKTYLARASNIWTYTAERFSVRAGELAADAPPLDPGLKHPAPQPLQPADRPEPDLPSLILLHDEDLHAESWRVDGLNLCALAGMDSLTFRSPLRIGERAQAFTQGALEDGLARASTHLGVTAERVDASTLVEYARSRGARQIVTQRAHTGPLRDQLTEITPQLTASGIAWVELRRDWDRAFYPHTTKGFFKVKKQIPAVLGELGLS